jgi:hypothetical protein
MGVSLVPLWTQREAEYEVEVAISEMRRDPWHRIAVRLKLSSTSGIVSARISLTLYDLSTLP